MGRSKLLQLLGNFVVAIHGIRGWMSARAAMSAEGGLGWKMGDLSEDDTESTPLPPSPPPSPTDQANFLSWPAPLLQHMEARDPPMDTGGVETEGPNLLHLAGSEISMEGGILEPPQSHVVEMVESELSIPTRALAPSLQRQTAPKNTRAASAGGGAKVGVDAKEPASSKDRHSKVQTMRGMRDRRMRLSVPAAQKFYDIQDRLNADHPSVAIEWLIANARHAIDNLPQFQPPEGASLLPSSQYATVRRAGAAAYPPVIPVPVATLTPPPQSTDFLSGRGQPREEGVASRSERRKETERHKGQESPCKAEEEAHWSLQMGNASGAEGGDQPSLGGARRSSGEGSAPGVGPTDVYSDDIEDSWHAERARSRTDAEVYEKSRAGIYEGSHWSMPGHDDSYQASRHRHLTPLHPDPHRPARGSPYDHPPGWPPYSSHPPPDLLYREHPSPTPSLHPSSNPNLPHESAGRHAPLPYPHPPPSVPNQEYHRRQPYAPPRPTIPLPIPHTKKSRSQSPCHRSRSPLPLFPIQPACPPSPGSVSHHAPPCPSPYTHYEPDPPEWKASRNPIGPMGDEHGAGAYGAPVRAASLFTRPSRYSPDRHYSHEEILAMLSDTTATRFPAGGSAGARSASAGEAGGEREERRKKGGSSGQKRRGLG